MNKQFSSPVVLDDLVLPFKPKRLQRMSSVASGSTLKFPEKLLKELIHTDPGILPVEELDRSFSGLRAVCQELPLAGGTKYIDNLLINPDGRICIVECKLWRNPEAVREVIAQILDYAAELSRLSYSELQSAAGKAQNRNERDFLVETVLGEGASEGQKVAFIDAVSQSLQKGAFLLLIAGDGIRSGLQQIAEMLNRSTLGFSLGLIEMAFYTDGAAGPYYVQPRMLFKTETVTRTVFVLADKHGKLTIDNVSEPVKLPTLSEQEFYQKLKAVDSNFPAEVSALIDSVKAAGCSPELKRTYMIYAEGPSQSIPLAQINSDGTVSVWGSAGRDAQIGLPIGLKYMETVAGILPGANIKSSFANQAGTSAIRNVQAFLSENFYRENQTGFLQWRRSQKVFSKLRVRPLLPNTRARET
jgi:hypothetical protein